MTGRRIVIPDLIGNPGFSSTWIIGSSPIMTEKLLFVVYFATSQKFRYAFFVDHQIVKNTGWLLLGQVVGRALRALVIIYSARILGEAGFGIFSYILNLAAVFTVFSDIGINAILIREGVKGETIRKKYLSASAFIKIGLLAVLSFIIIGFGKYFSNIHEADVFLPLVALIFTFDSLRDLGSAVGRSIERMDIEAKGQMITNLSVVLFSIIAVSIGRTVGNLVIAYISGLIIGLIAVVYPLREEFRGIIRSVDKKLFKEIIVSAWPFGIVSVMGVLMVQTDSQVIAIMTNAKELGLYSAAQKPIQVFYLIPYMLVGAFFPSMARAIGDKERFVKLLEGGLKASYFFALPLTIGGALLSKPIISVLYDSRFYSSWSSFTALTLTFVIFFPSVFVVNAIFAGSPKKWIFPVYSIIGVLGNAALDVILIGRLGIVGCAIATFIVQIILAIYGIMILRRRVNFSYFPGIWRIVVSSLLMGGTIIVLSRLGVGTLLNIAVSGTAYLASLLALKDDILFDIWRVIRKKPVTTPVEA